MESYNFQQQQQILQPPSWVINYSSGENSSSSTSLMTQNPKERRNSKSGSGVKLSTDPQSVAARQRRHRISDRFKVLKSLVPGGNKMDTVSMLEEAINYVKFLKTQIWLHQAAMMMPVNEEATLNFASYDSSIIIDNASIYNSISSMAPTQEMLSFDLPPLTPTLAPFPYCSFQEEEEEQGEEMIHDFGVNYY